MKDIFLKVQLICAPGTSERELDNMTRELAERLQRFSFVNRVEAVSGETENNERETR